MMGPTGGIWVVGASGFVGRAVVDLMAARGVAGTAISRSGTQQRRGSVNCLRIPGYDDHQMTETAAGCDAAIVLAGRAHIMRERAPDPCAAFMAANRDVPLAAAEAFAQAGGRRLVFVSSVAVHGTATHGRPFHESDPPAPVNDYGRSKLAGERALARCCVELGLELVIVRPPLVYGPNAPGNFGRLLRAAKQGIPLPLGAIDNRRDFIGIHNLADLLVLAARHPAAAGQTFLVSDRETLSTTALARRLYRAAGHGARIFPAPPGLLRLAAQLLGRGAVAAQLLDDLMVDASRARAALGWNPPLTVEEELLLSVKGSSS